MRPGLQLARWIDELCDRFEAAWEHAAAGSGLPPRVEDFLAQSPPEARGPLLRELLLIDLEFQPIRPRAETIAAWQRRFPEYADPIGELVQKIEARPARLGGESSDPDSSAASGPPPEVPGYSIEEHLGSGGMGVVYRARRIESGDQVALKLIVPLDSDRAKRLELFRREARILEGLNHPRIVRFLDAGSAGELWYMAMEYVPAIDLAQLLGTQPDPVRIRTLCGIAFQVLDGLAFAHDRSLVHRDVKPSNILVARSGRMVEAKLADFGLAKNYVHAGLSGITHLRDFRGTLAYMAPEQLLNPRDARPAADIYALGATLYRLLSGQHPVAADSEIEFHDAVLDGRIRPLAHVCPTVPVGLSKLVARAMARDPRRRFPSARAMRDALLPFARTSGSPPAPPAAPTT